MSNALPGFVDLGEPGDQRRKFDIQVPPITSNRARGLLELTVTLAHRRNDLEAALAVLAMERPQESGLVAAARAPRAAERHEHDVAAEARRR